MPNIKDFQEIAQQALKKTVTKDTSSIYNNAARDRKESINEIPRDPEPNVLHKFASYNALSVSYTHLTLPTIYSV